MTSTDTGQMVADLTSTNNAVQGNGWVSSGLGGAGGSLDLLGSTVDPLSGLASAGLGWFTSFVSFLNDGLNQLQGGSADSVSSGSQDFNNAGQNITGLAGSYGDSVNAQTSGWTGSAATDYRAAATQHATGVSGLGTASSTVGSSIIGAGQVVAEAIAEIAALIGQAVSQIVPIMTTAVSQASQTEGASVAAAIPPCVGIAVSTAAQIAAKLADLLSSGQNLLKLVQGALGVVDLIQQALSGISQQGSQGGTGSSTGPDPSQAGGGPTAASSAGPVGPTDSGNSGAPTDPSAGGSDGSGAGSGGGAGMPNLPDLSGATSPSGVTDGGSMPGLSGATLPNLDPTGVTQSAAVSAPFTGLPAAASFPGGTTPMSTSGTPTAGMQVAPGVMGVAAGARSAAASGADTVRQQRGRLSSAATSNETQGEEGMPMGGTRGARGQQDKEHKRKYTVVEQHDDDVVPVAPPVIGG